MWFSSSLVTHSFLYLQHYFKKVGKKTVSGFGGKNFGFLYSLDTRKEKILQTFGRFVVSFSDTNFFFKAVCCKQFVGHSNSLNPLNKRLIFPCKDKKEVKDKGLERERMRGQEG